MEHPEMMNAMIMDQPRMPLAYRQVPLPKPGEGQALIKIKACGICRTDLHVLDGELTEPKLPLIPGHEIIGTVVETAGEGDISTGDLVGIPWLGYTCGRCKYCLAGKENLCENAGFTGYTIDGGYAEYTVADMRFCFKLAEAYSKPEAAPLLCAGLIGYRSYSMISSSAKNIGMYGFGAAAHIIAQVAAALGKNVYAFTRDGDKAGQQFALKMGACWAGGSGEIPPEKLDAAILFAPAGELVPIALKNTDKGGEVICGGIHMSDIPSFSYDLLWGERLLKSVANLTRKDGVDFFSILKNIPVRTQTELFKLKDANEALEKFRSGKIKGAAVLIMEE